MLTEFVVGVIMIIYIMWIANSGDA